jgi:peptidoglycan/LPS O-acetylase OafA/YrhL
VGALAARDSGGPPGFLPRIESLRGIAALMVVAMHATQLHRQPGLRLLDSRLVRLYGRGSYSLYLLHPLAITGCRLLRRSGPAAAAQAVGVPGA